MWISYTSGGGATVLSRYSNRGQIHVPKPNKTRRTCPRPSTHAPDNQRHLEHHQVWQRPHITKRLLEEPGAAHFNELKLGHCQGSHTLRAEEDDQYSQTHLSLVNGDISGGELQSMYSFLLGCELYIGFAPRRLMVIILSRAYAD